MSTQVRHFFLQIVVYVLVLQGSADCLAAESTPETRPSPRPYSAQTVGNSDTGQHAFRAYLRRHVRRLALDHYRAGQSLPRNWIVPAPQALTQLRAKSRRGPTITWIGHATFLIQIKGRWILTDPVFSKRASPLPPFGPKRMAPPSLPLRALPKIDVILISHVHYDHLDFPTLRWLANRDKRTWVLAPRGTRSLLSRTGFLRIASTAKTGTSFQIGSFKFLSIRLPHDAGRGLPRYEREPTLGWRLRVGRLRIFFAGDTSYDSRFRAFRRRFGYSDVVLVPIGAYTPRRFVRHQHITPEEAVRIANDLGARLAVAAHWGTFALTPEPILEPPRRFLNAPSKSRLRRIVPRIGETILIPRPR